MGGQRKKGRTIGSETESSTLNENVGDYARVESKETKVDDEFIRLPLFEKYKQLPHIVSDLGYSDINALRESKSALDFFPKIGLYAYEFAIGYVFNIFKSTKLNDTRHTYPSFN